jgi:uncharacterized protein (TIGR02118 family)
MIKSVAVIKRRPGLTREEFCRYWKTEHGPLASRIIPGLRKYVQCHPVAIVGIEIEFDGIAEIWWDNTEALEQYLGWRKTNEARPLIEDEQKFIDTSQTVRFFAQENTIVELPR